jgi:hypothetical protein
MMVRRLMTKSTFLFTRMLPAGRSGFDLLLLGCAFLLTGMHGLAPAANNGLAPDSSGNALPRTQAEEVILSLYEFDFHKADKLSSGLLRENPSHYLSHFSRVYYYWWMMISSPRPVEFEASYRESIQRAIPLARNALDREPAHEHAFFFINLHAMMARLDLQQGAWIRTMKNLRHCVVQIERSMGSEAEFPGFYLTSGLYNYMTVEATRQYPFLRLYSLIYPEGNLELGIAQLKWAFDSEYPLWKTEAGYFLMRIFLELEKDPGKAMEYAAWLTSTYPSNLVFQYYHLQVLKNLRDNRSVALKKQEIKQLAADNPGISQAQRNYLLDLVNRP